MNYFKLNLSLFLVFLCILHPSYALKCFWTRGYRVTIANTIPNSNITVSCRSKDDDLGVHQLSTDGEFSWKFCASFWWTTRFSCHFQWEQKTKSLDVFTGGFKGKCGDGITVSGHCRWNVASDGFYFLYSAQGTYYKIIYVYNQEYEIAAAFWPDTWTYNSSIGVAQFLLMGLMSTKETASSAPFLIALPVLTLWFHRDTPERAKEPNLNLKGYLQSAYIHPVFKSDDSDDELHDVDVKWEKENV